MKKLLNNLIELSIGGMITALFIGIMAVLFFVKKDNPKEPEQEQMFI